MGRTLKCQSSPIRPNRMSRIKRNAMVTVKIVFGEKGIKTNQQVHPRGKRNLIPGREEMQHNYFMTWSEFFFKF